MAWVKFSDNFPNHPKVNGLSNEAFRLHVEGMCHANHYETGGTISLPTADMLASSVLRRLQVTMNARHERNEEPPVDVVMDLPAVGDLIEELLAAKVWDRVGDDFAIHDYHKYQPPKEELDARRARISAIRSVVGAAGAAARWGDGKTDGKTSPAKICHPRTASDSEQIDGKMANAKQTHGPGPVPVKRGSSLTGKNLSSSEEVGVAPPALAQPCGPAFDVVGQKGTTWRADTVLVADLSRCYPDVNVLHEMDLAASKIRAKAVTRKTATGMPKFLYAWMARVQNSTHAGTGHAKPHSTEDPVETAKTKREAAEASLAELRARRAKEGPRV